VSVVDLDAARAFMAGRARVLDRRRLGALLGDEDADGMLAAVDAYRNPDRGYGWGIEPDLRSVTSQPVGAMHAMEVFAEAAPLTTARAVELCDWLQVQTLDDGGLPFALSVPDTEGSSPIWTGADPASSSLQMTSQVAAHAHRLGADHPEIARHPWLAAATRYCLDAIRELDEPHAYALMFALRFLDAAAAAGVPGAEGALDALAPHVPGDGVVFVRGGAEGERLNPLDLSPRPDSPSRRLLDSGVFEADLERLVGRQQADGGWTVDYDTASPVAALEWRGYATVAAVTILLAHGA
jgi:hypothetical protein